ncbi:MAG: P-loop NTPase, partial [Alphaproteobacteria bacterium]
MSQGSFASQHGRMIVVASGKGGVGKTWFSISLAQALARKGRRVLLADADLGLANIDVQLGIQPDRDLSAVLSGKMTPAEAATRIPDAGFDVLAGRSGSGALASLSPAALD